MSRSTSGGNPGRSASRMLNRAGRRGASASKASSSTPGTSDVLSSTLPSAVTPVSTDALSADGGMEAKSDQSGVQNVGSYDIDWDAVKSGRPFEGEVFRARTEKSVSPAGKEVNDVADSAPDDTFDIDDLPAPLADPSSYGVDLVEEPAEELQELPSEDTGDEPNATPVTFSGEDFIPWEIVFIEGEDPRLIVRAALIDVGDELPGEDDEVPVVESSVALSAEDVDKLIKYTNRVEKFHSRESRYGRRFVRWVMRHKFFAGFTFTIVCYLAISEIVRSFT